VIDQNHRIICVDTTNGKEHDFSLFKNSKLGIREDIQAKVDLGYQGIADYHSNVEIPKKNSKNYKLTTEDKKENQEKASKRIFVEHINAKIKTFQMAHSKLRGLSI
jgi:hypothetical protein